MKALKRCLAAGALFASSCGYLTQPGAPWYPEDLAGRPVNSSREYPIALADLRDCLTTRLQDKRNVFTFNFETVVSERDGETWIYGHEPGFQTGYLITLRDVPEGTALEYRYGYASKKIVPKVINACTT